MDRRRTRQEQVKIFRAEQTFAQREAARREFEIVRQESSARTQRLAAETRQIRELQAKVRERDKGTIDELETVVSGGAVSPPKMISGGDSEKQAGDRGEEDATITAWEDRDVANGGFGEQFGTDGVERRQ